MVAQNSSIINLVAGGVGGTAGAVLTCPLEVVKVRLQSSKGEVVRQNGNGNGSNGNTATEKLKTHENCGKKLPLRRFAPQLTQVFQPNSAYVCCKAPSPSCSADLKCERVLNGDKLYSSFQSRNCQTIANTSEHESSFAIVRHLRMIVKKEGYRALFKGLGPNLVGIAPGKATYFYAYSGAKQVLNDALPQADTPLVHMCSAAYAGFIAATVVNPIWLVKTRLQLDKHVHSMSLSRCIAKVYKQDGILGFYRGVTASYAGISETMLQFVLYEYFRSLAVSDPNRRTELDYVKYMACGATAKLCATVLAYPHEVVRTRLREENSRYVGFFNALFTVAREEKRKGLYRGLSVHLLRTIPNTAITMGTYELVLVLLKGALATTTDE